MKANIKNKKLFNRPFLIGIGLAVLIVASSVFFFRYNSIAIGHTSTMILALGAISAIIVIVFSVILSNNTLEKKTFSRVYLSMLIISGLLYSAVFFPLSVPDELYHYESTYYYSNIMLGKNPSNSAIEVRETDSALIDNSDIKLDKSAYSNTKQAFNDNSGLSYIERTIDPSRSSLTSNPPQVRLFSAIGLSIGQILNLNGLLTFYLGRFFNFLIFAILAYFAIKITPVGKLLFVVLTFLPMTLHICSSFSYDAVIIGLGLLFIALCLNAAYSSSKVSKKTLIPMAISIVLLSPCKLIYSLLAFLVLIVPNNKFESTNNAKRWKFSIIALSMLSLLLCQSSILLSFVTATPVSDEATAQQTITETSSSPITYTLIGLLEAPLNTLFVFANTLLEKTDFYLTSFLGGTLGWFQSELITPWFFILLFLGILLYASRQSQSDTIILSSRTKAFFFALSGVISIGIALSMLLGHTDISVLYVEGVQGRYFLPFAPLIFLLFRTKNTRRNESSSPLILLTLFALNAMNLIYIWAAMARM